MNTNTWVSKIVRYAGSPPTANDWVYTSDMFNARDGDLNTYHVYTFDAVQYAVMVYFPIGIDSTNDYPTMVDTIQLISGPSADEQLYGLRILVGRSDKLHEAVLCYEHSWCVLQSLTLYFILEYDSVFINVVLFVYFTVV